MIEEFDTKSKLMLPVLPVLLLSIVLLLPGCATKVYRRAEELEHYPYPIDTT